MPDERVGHLVPAGDRTWAGRGALPPFHAGSGQGRIAVVDGLHEHTQHINTRSVRYTDSEPPDCRSRAYGVPSAQTKELPNRCKLGAGAGTVAE